MISFYKRVGKSSRKIRCFLNLSAPFTKPDATENLLPHTPLSACIGWCSPLYMPVKEVLRCVSVAVIVIVIVIVTAGRKPQ